MDLQTLFTTVAREVRILYFKTIFRKKVVFLYELSFMLTSTTCFCLV
jgi:hypothetical protein